ncbi:hypothetical protein B0T20DRAFT_205467 [Sordaria brevicollis]|uniref:Uncharacterized protein n=1 Tax=Sordaria brevicollis TaxID=83679 RepID=A0AAE0PEB1_SORBR|nr:hypothetical protein B0T20DRAFT_205467 [Sordaria brevicollis]
MVAAKARSSKAARGKIQFNFRLRCLSFFSSFPKTACQVGLDSSVWDSSGRLHHHELKFEGRADPSYSNGERFHQREVEWWMRIRETGESSKWSEDGLEKVSHSLFISGLPFVCSSFDDASDCLPQKGRGLLGSFCACPCFTFRRQSLPKPCQNTTRLDADLEDLKRHSHHTVFMESLILGCWDETLCSRFRPQVSNM